MGSFLVFKKDQQVLSVHRSSSPKFTMDIGVGDHAVQWLGVVFCLAVAHTQAERDIGCSTIAQ